MMKVEVLQNLINIGKLDEIIQLEGEILSKDNLSLTYLLIFALKNSGFENRANDLVSNYNFSKITKDKSNIFPCLQIFILLNKKQSIDKIIDCSLKNFKNDIDVLFICGEVLFNYKEYDLALELFKKVISINEKLPVSLLYIGLIYFENLEYELSISYLEKSMYLNPDEQANYYYIGLCHYELKKYKECIPYLEKYLEFCPNYDDCIMLLGNAYFLLGKYDRAIKLLKPYSLDESKIFRYEAQEFIENIFKIKKDKELEQVKYILEKIKQVLFYKGGLVTHFTSMETAKIMILNVESKFRLTEATFLNDPSEGNIIDDFLELNKPNHHLYKSKKYEYFPKPFIGSFVEPSNENNLTLWRMYGKDNNGEANGCSITINIESFLKSIEFFFERGKDACFFNVAYITNDELKPFRFYNDDKRKSDKLNDLMFELAHIVKTYKNKYGTINPLIPEINSIRYLFKAVEFIDEKEVRLIIPNDSKVMNGSFLNKESNRIYIETINLISHITKIHIGVKNNLSKEIATLFSYQFNMLNKHVDIFISNLPYK